MNMNKMGKLVLSALSVLGLAACAVSSTDEAVVLGESEQELNNGPTFSNGIFGSDTLHNVMTQAITESGVPLTYLGTGSGNGEKCMRGQPVVYGGNTYCNGSKDQTIAPMSRALNSPQSGEASHCVAKDGVALWVDYPETASNVALANVKGGFCGNGAGDATTCGNFDTWGEFTTGASNSGNTINFYRRDDVSGTTEVFKALVGCTTFCSGVKAVTDDALAGPRLTTDPAGTVGTPHSSSLVAYGGTRSSSTPCLIADTATECLGWIAALKADVVAYAGLAAHISGENHSLNVNTVAPTESNIRSGSYPLSRFLYVNEGNGSRDSLEDAFLDWAFNTDALRFEEILEENDFIACTDPDLGGHQPLDCSCP
ncbi:PstS family phosphate ABC transporter substrate-binding protein [Sorangium sp. So ce204]|uniref:PstS family phosphate ABC transporter substrate-binding protein n=1 Tax=Sorangium sp. So ce204 TaxID=3133288 RepID=UPI003F60FFD9